MNEGCIKIKDIRNIERNALHRLQIENEKAKEDYRLLCNKIKLGSSVELNNELSSLSFKQYCLEEKIRAISSTMRQNCVKCKTLTPFYKCSICSENADKLKKINNE